MGFVNIFCIDNWLLCCLLRMIKRLNFELCFAEDKIEFTTLALSFTLPRLYLTWWSGRNFKDFAEVAIDRVCSQAAPSSHISQRTVALYFLNLPFRSSLMYIYHCCTSVDRSLQTDSEFTTSFEHRHDAKGIRSILRRQLRPCKGYTDYLNETARYVITIRYY
jgi:hypothetical protein